MTPEEFETLVEHKKQIQAQKIRIEYLESLVDELYTELEHMLSLSENA